MKKGESSCAKWNRVGKNRRGFYRSRNEVGYGRSLLKIWGVGFGTKKGHDCPSAN